MIVMFEFVFPYRLYHGIACPFIPLNLYGPRNVIQAEGYVDSGAFCSVFCAQEALLLGINYKSVSPAYSMIGDGTKIPVYLHRLRIRIGTSNLSASIGFSEHLRIGFNLIGREGIFSRFDVTFSDKKKILILKTN